MLAAGDLGGQTIKELLHGGGRDFRQRQLERIVCARLNGSKDIGESVALVGAAGRALAAREPTIAATAFWPMRASSWNISRMRLPGCASATSLSCSASPLKSGLRRFVLLGVMWSGLLS